MAALALFRHPVARAAAISCFSMAAGDALCQTIRGRQAPPQQRHGIDWAQTARFATVGATLHGPFFYHAFRWLDVRFGQSTTLRQAAVKVAAGQVTIFPLYLGVFFV